MLASRDPAEVSIQEITEAADVGFGSFYNHFGSKADLFDAALAEAMEELGQLLDDVTRDIDGPAQVFAPRITVTDPGRSSTTCHEYTLSVFSRV
jgi:AcrR family transcriptional regulator